MNHYRTVFISDLHLGLKASQADEFLKFLKTFECPKMYLVGDFFDGWALKRSFYWPQSHNDVLQKLLRKSRKYTDIILIPGNHDEFARKYIGLDVANVSIMDSDIHVALDNKKYLVIHGDQFDVVIQNIKWLAHLGSRVYDISMWANSIVNKIRKWFGLPFWSLSGALKKKVKGAVNFIGNYETALSDYAKMQEVDGVICGHIHSPSDKEINGIHYLNCGDWVEHCTALVEHMDGRMELIKWTPESQQS